VQRPLTQFTAQSQGLNPNLRKQITLKQKPAANGSKKELDSVNPTIDDSPPIKIAKRNVTKV